jgi:uncharacterized protein (TIGR02246 family)
MSYKTILVSMIFGFCVSPLQGDDAAPPIPPEVKASAEAFTSAFNKGDAAATAALWTQEGEYISETGKRFQGRKAIQDEYAKFFKAQPGVKIRLEILNARLVGASLAMEEGTAVLILPTGVEASRTNYSAVHTKVGNQWLIASCKDSPSAKPGLSRAIDDLDWLIGKWVAEEYGSKTESECKWIANKNYVQRTYTVTHPDGSQTSGLQIIGFNSGMGAVQSWNFDSSGGMTTGTWQTAPGGWAARMQGSMADGTASDAINLLIRLDDNAYAWKSVRRSIGGQPLPDTSEVILRRAK